MSSISIFNLMAAMNETEAQKKKCRCKKCYTAKFVKLNDKAVVPTKGSSGSAGYDLCACLDKNSVEIRPHETVMISTGLAIQPPKGYFGAIYARSGLATKQGLRPANCVGVIDEDYRGTYIVALHNDTDKTRYVRNGDRIAQLVFMPYLNVEFQEVDSLDKTDRGAGGFGSTGK